MHKNNFFAWIKTELKVVGEEEEKKGEMMMREGWLAELSPKVRQSQR